MSSQKAKYVRVQEATDGTKTAIVLEVLIPAGHDLIPSPKIELATSPFIGVYEFTYMTSNDNLQASIASAYGVTQQTASRWLKKGKEVPHV